VGILYGKEAMQCTATEVRDEVWAQMKAHLNVGGAEILQDGNLLSWFLDPDIQFPNPSAVTNLEPLPGPISKITFPVKPGRELARTINGCGAVRRHVSLTSLRAIFEYAR
jgi:hypothetical protein